MMRLPGFPPLLSDALHLLGIPKMAVGLEKRLDCPHAAPFLRLSAEVTFLAELV